LPVYLSWLFRFALGAAAFLAVLQIVIGGIQMIISGASETVRSDAKKRISDAIWGLLLALGSYLILNIVSPQFTKMELTIPKVILNPPRSEWGSDETTVRKHLEENGIGVKSECAAGQTKDCVSLTGIRTETIEEIVDLKNKSGCKNCPPGGGDCVYITAGTEGGHATGEMSHATGYKVDLSATSCVTNFITKSNEFTYKNKRSRTCKSTGQTVYDDVYVSSSGAEYALEQDCAVMHWDVKVPGAGTMPEGITPYTP